jgi:hypothetical protein
MAYAENYGKLLETAWDEISCSLKSAITSKNVRGFRPLHKGGFFDDDF